LSRRFLSHPVWLRDSITRRFAVAIAGTAAVCITFDLLIDLLIGGLFFQPSAPVAWLPLIPSIVHTMETAAPTQRKALAQRMVVPQFQVAWYPADQSPAGTAAFTPLRIQLDPSKVVTALSDGSTLAFIPTKPNRRFNQPIQWVLRIGILISSVLIVSMMGASRLARPIEAFAAAARRFGADPNARPIPNQGPAEMQLAIDAFNAMQTQIQRSIAGQAAMFAAISHDLRTPLTRMRLRGEFIEDIDQQARLFRDIDEMQTMIQAVLVFLRDNTTDEETTKLDLAELLRMIADEYADLGHEVTYTGPLHLAFPGRPIALRRAFGNLVDNAVKYGVAAAIDLQCQLGEVKVIIRDQGPGIPDEALEKVFAPFKRMEPSRNRHTGGMGLGLTAARAGFQAHGGDVTLSNARDGGLQAVVVLPLPDQAGEVENNNG
jgi:two-component system osmolarity sensor histidine kinase EnvZ